MENQLWVQRIRTVSYCTQTIRLIRIHRALEIALILNCESPIRYEINILAISCNILSKSEI